MKVKLKEQFLNQPGQVFFMKVAKSLLPEKEFSLITNELKKDLDPTWPYKSVMYAAINNSKKKLKPKNYRFLVSLLNGFHDPHEIFLSHRTGKSPERIWQDIKKDLDELDRTSLFKDYQCVECGATFVAERHLIENEHPFDEMCICDECLPEKFAKVFANLIETVTKEVN